MEEKLKEDTEKSQNQPKDYHILGEQLMQMIEMVKSGQQRNEEQIEVLRETFCKTVESFKESIKQVEPEEKKDPFEEIFGSLAPLIINGAKAIDMIISAL